MTKHRLELFSDGVFAIVLTILVLDLKVPTAHGLTGLAQTAPALLVHAATFAVVGVLWNLHHGALARVMEVSSRSLMLNLLALFWVTLMPFGAKNAAERPLDPLGAAIMATSCGCYLASASAMRLTVHSTIDDNPAMSRWKRGRILLAACLVVANLACAALSWASPWIGYACVLVTVTVFVVLPAPPEVEQKFVQQAAA
jgi:uncharacterized membrane protein